MHTGSKHTVHVLSSLVSMDRLKLHSKNTGQFVALQRFLTHRYRTQIHSMWTHRQHEDCEHLNKLHFAVKSSLYQIHRPLSAEGNQVFCIHSTTKPFEWVVAWVWNLNMIEYCSWSDSTKCQTINFCLAAMLFRQIDTHILEAFLNYRQHRGWQKAIVNCNQQAFVNPSTVAPDWFARCFTYNQTTPVAGSTKSAQDAMKIIGLEAVPIAFIFPLGTITKQPLVTLSLRFRPLY